MSNAYEKAKKLESTIKENCREMAENFAKYDNQLRERDPKEYERVIKERQSSKLEIDQAIRKATIRRKIRVLMGLILVGVGIYAQTLGVGEKNIATAILCGIGLVLILFWRRESELDIAKRVVGLKK